MKGFVSKGDFGNQSKSLIYDIFILNIVNKQVREKLCTEQKSTPGEALQFAIAFEHALEQQKSIGKPANQIDEDERRTSMPR